MAAEQCNQELLRVLFEHGANGATIAGELALRRSTRSCDVETIRLLLERGCDPNANYYWGGSVLMEAVARGEADIVRLLLDNGADPNQGGKYEGWVQPKIGESTPLMLAAKSGRLDLITVLLDGGADASASDVYGYTALRVAQEAGFEEAVGLLQDGLSTQMR